MKIVPFRMCRLVLTMLCMCPPEESASNMQKLYYAIYGGTNFLVVFLHLVSSLIYFIENGVHDLEKSLYSLYQVSGAISLSYMIGAAFILRSKIKTILTELEKIYKADEDKETFRFLEDANKTTEWIWLQYFKYVIIGFTLNTVSLAAISVIYCMKKYGHFDPEHVYYSIKNTVPWNSDDLEGYLLLTFFNYLGPMAYLFTNGSLMLFFVSMCLQHQAFYKRFLETTQQFESNKDKKNEGILVELIRFRITVGKWFKDSANIYGHFILVLLIGSMIFLSSIILQLDMKILHPDSNLNFLFWAFVVSASNLFIYCFFGKLATESYLGMADCLYESDWQVLPKKLQMYLILMISNAQQPIYYHGFGVAILNLETFRKLLRTVFSYYMLFKTFLDTN